MPIYCTGLLLGAGLILAIGAQNVFLLTQSIKKQHHWLIALICSASDVVLIFLGANGLGSLMAQSDVVQQFARLGGAGFLFYIGIRSFLEIKRSKSLVPGEVVQGQLRNVVVMTLSFTFLNPHVYLDTVILLGGIGSQYTASMERLLFAGGAATASVIWFFGLALGGMMLSPLFARPAAWKVLDFCVGVIMCVIGWQLLDT